MKDFLLLNCMKHSPIANYAGIPGLTSWLIGEPHPERGLVRLFECSRQHYEAITPHSHRFDFHCEVLSGVVMNVVWTPDASGDLYQETKAIYAGQPGKYRREPGGIRTWKQAQKEYRTGDSYAMTSAAVHSIYFSRGARVLFFEGPAKSDYSIILEPVVDGDVITTFATPSWAFKKVPG